MKTTAWAVSAALLAAVLVTAGQGLAAWPFFDEDENPTLAPLLSQVTPAVVNVAVAAAAPEAGQDPLLSDPFLRRFFDLPDDFQPQPQPQQGIGSGVIVDAAEGLIVSNSHVVQNADDIVVTLTDRRRFAAEVVGSDPATDVALLRIEADDLSAIEFGDSDELDVGDFVVAIGNPFGLGQTATAGIVSALGRGGINLEGYEDFIQTDASINPGNSGGALVGLNGKLMGINTAILSATGGNIGIGFAVPSNLAKNVMDQLVVNGRVHRGLLGVTVQGVTGDLAAGLGLDKAEGAIVSDVTPDGAAAKAGIKQGDVILGYQGRPVIDTNAFRNEIAATKPGSTVTLKVLRDGKTMEVKPTLEEMTAARDGSRSLDGEREGSGKYGMTVEPITPELARQLNLDRDIRGVVITNVDPSGAAASAGLREGDVIQQVNGESVDDAGDVRDALNAVSGKPSVLLITRGEATIFVPLRAR